MGALFRLISKVFLGGLFLRMADDWWMWPFNDEGEEAVTNPYGSYTPEQTAFMKQFGPYLQNLFTSGAPQYTGQFTAPLTAGESDAIQRQSQMAALGYSSLSDLLNRDYTEDYFNKGVYAPMVKKYTEDIAPLIQEQYAGPEGAGYWGTARAGAMGKGYRDLMDTLTAEKSKMELERMKMIPTTLDAANRLALSSMATQGVPREIQQLGLNKQYEEWVRTRPEQATYLNAALNFLGITGAGTYTPAKPSMWEQLFPELIKSGSNIALLAALGGL